MFDKAAREWLQKPLLARLSTIDRSGYPHTVPVWFMLEGDDILFISVRETAKVGYMQVNSKGAVAIGGDSGDGGGYLIKGELSVEADPGFEVMKKMIYRYEMAEQAEKDIADWSTLDMIVIRMKPTKALKF